MSSAQGTWDIDPAGVNSVVGRTEGIARGLEGEVTAFAAHLKNAADNAGTLSQGGNNAQGGHSGQGGQGSGFGLVAVALSQFAQATEKSLAFIAERSGRSLQGAVAATKEYLQGDQTMAAEAQQQALSGTRPPAIALPPQGAKK